MIIHCFTPDQLQFISVKVGFVCPSNTASHVYFSTDETLIYTAFFADFGPLNLGLVYTFCKQLHEIMNPTDGSRKMVVYYCQSHPHRRANSAVLLCAYMVGLYCCFFFVLFHCHNSFIITDICVKLFCRKSVRSFHRCVQNILSVSEAF